MTGLKGQWSRRPSANGMSIIEAQGIEPRRTATLRELRPLKLIGLSRPLYPWSRQYVEEDALRRYKNKDTRRFYEHQNAVIEGLQQVDAVLGTGLPASLLEEYGDDIGEDSPRQRQSVPSTVRAADLENAQNGAESAEAASARIQFWVNLNMLANVVLLAGKLAVYLMTSSLSIVASLVDSVLDLLSTLIIFASTRVADQRDWKTKHLYPVGRYRLEPIGVLVFSVVMIVSFLRIAQEAVQQLVEPVTLIPVEIGVPSIVVMIFTIVVKVVLWYLCRTVPSSSVQALAQDAETDVTFNFFSIVFPVAGHILNQWSFDPLGALILAIYVVYSWYQTAMQHIDNLTGAAASPEERQQLLYLCIRFSSRIKAINSLNAYHAGDRLMCEVDVVFDSELSKRDLHDLAEALQYALETMPIVERAFVHIDYRRDNFSGHVV